MGRFSPKPTLLKNCVSLPVDSAEACRFSIFARFLNVLVDSFAKIGQKVYGEKSGGFEKLLDRYTQRNK